MRTLLFFILAALCLSPILTKAQTARYQIEVAGIDIGTQTVHQTRKGDTVRVQVTSKVKISMVFTYSVTYTQHSVYVANKLYEAEVRILKNGEVEKTTTTRWVNGHYEITTNGKRKTFSGTISHSGTRMYFHEPVGVFRSYNEADGVIIQIKKTGNGVYKATNPEDGRINEFFYKNGTLQKAVIHNPLLNFTSTLIE